MVPNGSTDSIDDFGFEYFPTTGATIPGTTEILSYHDYEYEVTGLDFTQYQIKIVFVSQNQALVPTIRDLRAIALAV